jgi:hypothetical protein
MAERRTWIVVSLLDEIIKNMHKDYVTSNPIAAQKKMSHRMQAQPSPPLSP